MWLDRLGKARRLGVPASCRDDPPAPGTGAALLRMNHLLCPPGHPLWALSDGQYAPGAPCKNPLWAVGPGRCARTIAALPALIARQMMIPRTVQTSHSDDAKRISLAPFVPRSGPPSRHPHDTTRLCIRIWPEFGRITARHVRSIRHFITRHQCHGTPVLQALPTRRLARQYPAGRFLATTPAAGSLIPATEL
jgi:hypothetical protein